MHSCVHVCTLACGLPDGRPGENMRMPDIKVYDPHITMYIESGARNGSAAFYWSSSGCWMGVPIRNIRHTASWRCEIAGSGGAARMAELLIAATTRAPARHRRDIVLGAKSQIRVCSHDAPRTYWTRIHNALAARRLSTADATHAVNRGERSAYV